MWSLLIVRGANLNLPLQAIVNCRGCYRGEMAETHTQNWLDKTSLGAIGVLTLSDGSSVTVELTGFDEESDELVVDVIDRHSSDAPRRRSIPASEVVSFDPERSDVQPWPYSDPCRNPRFSAGRFALLTTMFVSVVPGSIPFFLTMVDKPYGIQQASAIVYTVAVVFVTFAATRQFRPYMFTCPAVQPQLPRLLLRHVWFLAALFGFQTAALSVRPGLPDWWNVRDQKGGTPFELVMLFLAFGLGFAEVYMNRSVLARAHEEFHP